MSNIICWLGSQLAGNFPHYLAGTENFAHDHPGSAEHLFLKATLKNAKKIVLLALYWRFIVRTCYSAF